MRFYRAKNVKCFFYISTSYLMADHQSRNKLINYILIKWYRSIIFKGASVIQKLLWNHNIVNFRNLDRLFYLCLNVFFFYTVYGSFQNVFAEKKDEQKKRIFHSKRDWNRSSPVKVSQTVWFFCNNLSKTNTIVMLILFVWWWKRSWVTDSLKNCYYSSWLWYWKWIKTKQFGTF